MPRKRPRRRVATGRPRPQAPTGANQVWAHDFVFDRCANGQQLKCLTVTDEWTREGLAIEVDGRIRSTRVIEVLARLVSERGAPLFLGSDNGPEFVSRALLAWIVAQRIHTALINPGKPWQNANGESFNGKFRDKCLSLEWFRSRAEAKVVIESWRRHYNEVRPHSSLGISRRPPSRGWKRHTQRPAMQRAGTLRYVGPPRPGPLHHSPARGNRGSRLKLSLVREKQGSSDLLRAQARPRTWSTTCWTDVIDAQRLNCARKLTLTLHRIRGIAGVHDTFLSRSCSVQSNVTVAAWKAFSRFRTAEFG